MQNDEIKFKIEEIEKRISKTYKTGNINNPRDHEISNIMIWELAQAEHN